MAKKNVTTATEIENDEVQLDKDSEKRIDEIVNEYTNSDDIWVCKLKKPIKYEENEYESLTFNFDKLSGYDGIEIEDELMLKGKPVFMNETANVRYLMQMALLACEERIDLDTLKKLSLSDFNRIKNKARLFLLNAAV